MEKYKFKRNYTKLYGQKKGKLILTETTYKDFLTDDFLKMCFRYDETIELEDLPRGFKFLLLFFVCPNHMPFPEIIKFTHVRLEKYKALEGMEFEFSVLEPKELVMNNVIIKSGDKVTVTAPKTTKKKDL